jgi:NitT/TauT family transport system permease protein
MVIATYEGVDGVDRSLIRMAQSFGVPSWTIARHIILPGAMPAILSGIQISTFIGVLLLTAAEMIAAQHGIGALVVRAGNLMRTDELMVGVLLLSTIGIGASKLISAAKRRLLRWR